MSDTMTKTIGVEQLQELATLGAKVRLAELQHERDAAVARVTAQYDAQINALTAAFPKALSNGDWRIKPRNVSPEERQKRADRMRRTSAAYWARVHATKTA